MKTKKCQPQNTRRQDIACTHRETVHKDTKQPYQCKYWGLCNSFREVKK